MPGSILITSVLSAFHTVMTLSHRERSATFLDSIMSPPWEVLIKEGKTLNVVVVGDASYSSDSALAN